MGVVINDFEVVSQPQEGSTSTAPAPQQAPRPPQVREMEQIMRRQRERMARVRAH
ncbi:MAG TPA: hypothetical protein VGE04_20810 [Chloroflexia bacterium]|jgi:hypothetical protein